MATHAPSHQKIAEQLRVSHHVRDLDWLKTSLNAAIELELSTLPPYLCGYWSIKDPGHVAAKLIRSVLLEEMVHMGLVANMLASIGGTPQINTRIPTYPGPLPGGVRPQVTVYLAGLSKPFLRDVCMQIEYPEQPVDSRSVSAYPTIGAFYDAIQTAFVALNPEMSANNQLTADLGSGSVIPMKSLKDVTTAILEIKEQGEGTGHSPEAEDFGSEYSHYYKFAEIYHGRTLVQTGGKWTYRGEPIPFPETWPMARVPENGWESPSQAVVDLLNQGNSCFASLLDHLQKAWETGSADELNAGIDDMFKLKDPAVRLMQIPRPDGTGNYGPDFRLS